MLGWYFNDRALVNGGKSLKITYVIALLKFKKRFLTACGGCERSRHTMLELKDAGMSRLSISGAMVIKPSMTVLPDYFAPNAIYWDLLDLLSKVEK